MKRIITTTILALTLALGGAAAAYTPTPAQCAAAGGFFNTATQGCDVGSASPVFVFTPAPRNIAAVPGVTYQVNTGDTIFYSGTIVYVTSPGTVTFCPCPNWD